MELIVTAKRLNQRKAIPLNFPDKDNIISVAVEGQRFIGEEVSASEIKNPSLGKWYKDRDGYYYWGGGVIEVGSPTVSAAIPVVEPPQQPVVEDSEIPWWMQQLDIPYIWSTYDERGERAKVAVIDSGYNVNNPEIKDGVVTEYVPDGLLEYAEIINDKFGHGSYCASLIGARNRNFKISCAPECKLIIAKGMSKRDYQEENISDCIQRAIDEKADVISLSFGGVSKEEINTLVNKAIDNNIIVVAAIGNNMTNAPVQGGDYPALLENCIAVGATTQQQNLSLVTLINPKTEINAPGENITGYVLDNIPGMLNSGTSQATAIITGICALIVSRHKKLGIPYSVKSIRDLITQNYNPVLDRADQKLISPKKIFEKIKN